MMKMQYKTDGDNKLMALSDDKPRYVRVNTLSITTDEVIKQFRQEGWRLIPPKDSYDDFLETITRLSDDFFTCDYHLQNLLIFPSKSCFYRHPLYVEGKILLQDKASCLAPYVLDPDKKSTVLDLCAAPGMKTTLLSALVRTKGRVIALEKSERRYRDLLQMIEIAGCSNVTTINGDALNCGYFNGNSSHDWCEEAEFILVDPSCSGTGMVDRTNIFAEEKCEPKRLKKLARFQFKLLYHALTNFPKARRVVYSTCSTLTAENEQVVHDVLAKLPEDALWHVVSALPDKWRTRGSDEFPDIGPKCVVATPDSDLTNGFFIAMFERAL